MRLSLAQCWTFLTAGDRGVLSTRNQHDTIDAVPVCFAVVGETVVSPVDRIKPKETVELARVWNARHTGTATLLCDHWDPDDWSRLWWVRAHLVLREDSAAESAPRSRMRCAASTASTATRSSPTCWSSTSSGSSAGARRKPEAARAEAGQTT